MARESAEVALGIMETARWKVTAALLLPVVNLSECGMILNKGLVLGMGDEVKVEFAPKEIDEAVTIVKPPPSSVNFFLTLFNDEASGSHLFLKFRSRQGFGLAFSQVTCSPVCLLVRLEPL